MDMNVVNYGRIQGTYFDREITKEIYERAIENNGYLTDNDEKIVLTDAERYGYGGSTRKVFEQEGKYYVHCHMYNHCD